MAYLPLEWGSFCRAQEDNGTSTLEDFIPATTAEMGTHFLSTRDMWPAGRYPFSVDFMRKERPMVFGAERYQGRGCP